MYYERRYEDNWLRSLFRGLYFTTEESGHLRWLLGLWKTLVDILQTKQLIY